MQSSSTASTPSASSGSPWMSATEHAPTSILPSFALSRHRTRPASSRPPCLRPSRVVLVKMRTRQQRMASTMARSTHRSTNPSRNPNLSPFNLLQSAFSRPHHNSHKMALSLLRLVHSKSNNTSPPHLESSSTMLFRSRVRTRVPWPVRASSRNR